MHALHHISTSFTRLFILTNQNPPRKSYYRPYYKVIPVCGWTDSLTKINSVNKLSGCVNRGVLVLVCYERFCRITGWPLTGGRLRPGQKDSLLTHSVCPRHGPLGGLACRRPTQTNTKDRNGIENVTEFFSLWKVRSIFSLYLVGRALVEPAGVNLRDTDLRSRRTNTKDRKSHSPVAFRSYIPVLQLSLLALSFWFLACRSHYKYDTRTRQTASRSNCRIRSSHWRTLFFMIQQIKFKIQNAIDKKWDSEIPSIY